MPKTLDILKYFPDFHQATNRGKLLYHVTDAVASHIQGIENDMIEIMKSHWIKAVENIDELERIAALYRIEREEYENLNQFRTKVRDIIRLYLAGPGTVPAVIEFVAIALRKYGIEIKRDQNGNPVITHPVGGDEFRTRCHFEESKDFPDSTKYYIEINENPIIEKSYIEGSIRHLEKAFLENRGFFYSCPEIIVRGYNSRTVNPVLFNRSTGHALGFLGIVPGNSVLRIKANEQKSLDIAELDGKDVKNKIFSLNGSQFDRCCFDQNNSVFAVYRPDRAFNKIGFAEKGDECPPNFDIPLPVIPLGESEWEFRIEKSMFNGSKFDEDAFTFPDEKSGVFDAACFDESVFLIEHSAGLEIKWKEHQRAMFEIFLPYSIGVKKTNSTDIPEQEEQFKEPLQSVSKMMEQVKPAGVKVLVKYYSEDNVIV